MLLKLLVYFFVFAVVATIFHAVVRYSKEAKVIDRLPGPMAYPIFGNLLSFNCSAEKIWERVLQFYDTYYPTFRLWGFKSFGVFIRHPEDIKILVSSKTNINKADTFYKNIRFVGNEGLLVSGGDKWRQRRKMMNPAFNPNLIKEYLEIVNEHTTKLIDSVKALGDECVVNLNKVFLKFSLAIVCEATMGIDLKTLGEDRENDFKESLDVIFNVTLYRMARPYIQNWMMRFLSIGRGQFAAMRKLNNIAIEIIKERRKYHESTDYQLLKKFRDGADSSKNDDEIDGSSKRLSVLDLLLAAELDGLIDEAGIEEEVVNFVSAGYETVGTAMSFALMLLAENKTSQDLARQDSKRILDECQGVLKMTDIHRFEYLERCIKETLRLYPTVPVVDRSISEELRLRHFTVPVGTETVFHIYALHRDANYWPDPDKFDPDRFSPENLQKIQPYSYIPFSSGLRTCIGQKLASMEMKAVLSRLLCNFTLEPVDSTRNVKFTLHFTLKPTQPLHVKFVTLRK